MLTQSDRVFSQMALLLYYYLTEEILIIYTEKIIRAKSVKDDLLLYLFIVFRSAEYEYEKFVI